MNFKKLLESLVLVALATVGIAGAASLHTGSARQQMDTSVLQTMLSPLLTKYQIHEPLAYTDEGLKDTLEAIQSKIVEEFRSLESVFDRRISKAVSSQALKKNASAGCGALFDAVLLSRVAGRKEMWLVSCHLAIA